MADKWSHLFERIVKWRWLIISAVGAFVFLFEYIEHAGILSIDNYHLIEIGLYTILLVTVAILMDRLSHAWNDQIRTTKILEMKHQLSLQLDIAKDWDELTASTLQYLVSICQPACAFLLVHDPVGAHFLNAAEWRRDGRDCSDPLLFQPITECSECANNSPDVLRTLKNCARTGIHGQMNADNSYCLPLIYGSSLVAIMRFFLTNGTELSREQSDTLNNVRYELAIALVMGQQRKSLADIRMAEAAISERRSFSRDLHDTLGQNLAYLRLKLDDMVTNNSQYMSAEIQAELVDMRSVCAESIAMVRSMLTMLQPDTQANLGRLLLEYGQVVTRRAKNNLDFRIDGQPRPVTTQVQNQILYVYREALNNIERHASANNVLVSLTWTEKDLAIDIVDDGKGFDQQQLDTSSHFGLAIMRERIELMNGKFTLTAVPNGGTRIQIWLPI